MRPDAIAVPEFPRAHDYCGVWAIDPTAGAALYDLIRSTDLAAHVARATPPTLAAASDYQTVRAANGEQVAVIPLAGTLMKAASSMGSATSTVAARRAIRKAAADSEVSAILLAIDSPGGTVSGTADLANEVRAARKTKPVWAFAEDLAASAAYWVGSQADRFYANDPTALVGSIGTLAVVYDLSAAAEKEGVKALVFGTGPLKGAGAPGAPVTDEQQAYFRGLVEDAQTSFDAAVRRGRGLTERQLADAKTGGVFGAVEALERKLIDGIKSFDSVVTELAAEARRGSRGTRAAGPLLARGVTVDETTTQQQPAAVAATAPTVDPVAEFRAAMAAETARVAGIQKACGANAALASEAIAGGWSVEKAELHALRASLANGIQAGNPHVPNVATGRGKWMPGREAAPGVSVNDALECALLSSLGRKSVEKEYGEKTLQAAHESFRHLGLQQMLMIAAVQNGYAGGIGERITGSNLRGVLKAAFRGDPVERGATTFSTVSLPGILANTANKEILSGYMEEDQTWREIAAVKSVNDFKTVTSYRLLDNMAYEEIGPGGKIKGGTITEESYTRQAKTYAKMFSLTRQDIINDDLGAFMDLRNRLGRGAAQKFNDVFWTEFLSDASTFWTTARTNYITGATTTLLEDGVGLGLAIKAFRQMTSPSSEGSKRIGGMPEILLVPPELEKAASALFVNNNLATTSAVLGGNIYINKYRPVVCAWLSDSAFTGYSTTAWYLLRNPALMPAIVASFLNGMQSPTVEDSDADFDTLGVEFRGYHDFGCDQAEYLCGIKSKGAA